jgi:hypothetical protein
MGSPKDRTNRQVRKAYDTLINGDEELTERETDIQHNLFLIQIEDERVFVAHQNKPIQHKTGC